MPYVRISCTRSKLPERTAFTKQREINCTVPTLILTVIWPQNSTNHWFDLPISWFQTTILMWLLVCPWGNPEWFQNRSKIRQSSENVHNLLCTERCNNFVGYKITENTSIANPFAEIRRSYDRFISIMWFSMLVRWHLYICKGRLPVVLVRVLVLFSRTFSRFWFCGSRKTGTWLRFQELLSAWFDYWLDVAMFGARTSCARWFAPYNGLKLIFGRPQRLTVCK